MRVGLTLISACGRVFDCLEYSLVWWFSLSAFTDASCRLVADSDSDSDADSDAVVGADSGSVVSGSNAESVSLFSCIAVVD